MDHIGDVVPLVAVRPEVMAEAEHAFGNLFHRLHYSAQKLRNQGVEGASSIEETIAELEDFLRLTLDYASPLAVDLQNVGAMALLGSLTVAIGCAPPVVPASLATCELSADPGRLSEAFQLMSCCLGQGADERHVEASLEERDGAAWLAVEGSEVGRNHIPTGRNLVAWALAQKLIEAQGGTLVGEPRGDGFRWGLRLPVPRDR